VEKENHPELFYDAPVLFQQELQVCCQEDESRAAYPDLLGDSAEHVQYWHWQAAGPAQWKD